MRKILFAAVFIAWCASPLVANAAIVMYRFDGTLTSESGVYASADGPVSGLLTFDYNNFWDGILPKDSPPGSWWSTQEATPPVFTGIVTAGSITVDVLNPAEHIGHSWAQGRYLPASDGIDPWSGLPVHNDERYEFASTLTFRPTENSYAEFKINFGGPSSLYDENGLPLPFSDGNYTGYRYGNVQLFPAGASGDQGSLSFTIDSLSLVPLPSSILLFTPAIVILLSFAIRRSIILISVA